MKQCCGDCSNGHGRSEIMYDSDGYRLKDKISDLSATINENTDFSFAVQGHSLQEKYSTYCSYIYAIGSPGVAFLLWTTP